jgi:hypothetical protein
MSSFPRPKLSAWERAEHDGSYQAERFGWTLQVKWTPNTPAERGYFKWSASYEGDEGNEDHRTDMRFEEPEAAMSAAECFAQDRPMAEEKEEEEQEE